MPSPDTSRPRTHRSRGASKAIPLPFEYTVTVSVGMGLRPRTSLRCDRGGLRLRLRGLSASVTIDRFRRTARLGRESRARVEGAINARVGTRQQVAFERDEHGILGWGSAPVQAEGHLGDMRFRFRFRFNHAHLSVYDPAMTDEHGEPTVILTAAQDDVYPGDDYAGSFDNDSDMVDTFVGLVQGLAPVDFETNPTYQQQLATAVARYAAEDEALYRFPPLVRSSVLVDLSDPQFRSRRVEQPRASDAT